MSEANAPKFDQWALVEIMGHQRAAGRVTEEAIAGVAMLRIDIPKGPDSNEFITQYINTGSIFRMTPTTETAVRAALTTWVWKPPSLAALEAEPRAQITYGAGDAANFDDIGDDEIPL